MAPVVVVVEELVPVEPDALVVLAMVLVVVEVGGLIPSQSLEILTSAQFQNLKGKEQRSAY